MEPITRQEQLLNSIATGDSAELEPITREEMYLSAIAGSTESKPEKPITRKEMFYEKIIESGGVGGDGGEVGKPYIDTSKMTSLQSFFSSRNSSLLADLDKFDTSNVTDFSNMFFYVDDLKSVPQFDTSKGENFNGMFYGCISLESPITLDVSRATKVNTIFSGCVKLTNISLSVAKTDFNSTAFSNCTALTNLTIGEGWAVSIYLTYSNNLSVESLHGMIENLADLTGETAKTFSVGETNLAKIDEEHIAMLQTKNWNYS